MKPPTKTPPWCPECGAAVRYRIRTTEIMTHTRPKVGDRFMRYDEDINLEEMVYGRPAEFVRCSATVPTTHRVSRV